MELVPPWYSPTLEDIFNLRLNDEISVNLNTRFHRADKFSQMKILGPNGLISLSIPVKKHISNSPIGEIKIDYIQKWQNQHWRSIQSGYGRSPFFEYYEKELKELFYHSPQFLTDFTVPIFRWVCKQYFPIKYFSVILAENMVDFQPKGQLHMSDNKDKQLKNGLENYSQVFGQEFVSGLSVWDALFCKGPNF